ncbi:MAG: GNAT family N-acetyltransferase [Lentisphaeraceae bacterium]|nr:GNAT family N-acetyltransferase [Lentisphaeraceae bacterium]
MSKNILIRPASKADVQFLVDANYNMALETEDLKLDEKTLSLGVSAVIRDAAKGEYMVAEKDGFQVGCLLLTYEWSDWRNKQVVWIQSLYVVPEMRGQGIFKAMFAKVQSRVASGEFAGVRLYVDKTNEKAQQVYSQLGMNGDHYLLFEKMADN